MVKIITHRTKGKIFQHTVPNNPIKGSYAEYILLKNELSKLDERFTSNEYQHVFNINFLKKQREKYGKLHCVYCNKQDLVIYEFHEKFQQSNGATTDHILPIFLRPDLAKDENNCAVACFSCNNKKGSKLQEIKYPYE